MTKIKIVKGLTWGWEGEAYLGDMPNKGYTDIVKSKSRAKEFFSKEQDKVELLLEENGVEYEVIGDRESRPITRKSRR